MSSEGQVAEQGTYQELSSNPNGAFSKLMEWQLSGVESSFDKRTYKPEGTLTEAEEIDEDLAESSEDFEEENTQNGTASKSESPVKRNN